MVDITTARLGQLPYRVQGLEEFNKEGRFQPRQFLQCTGTSAQRAAKTASALRQRSFRMDRQDGAGKGADAGEASSSNAASPPQPVVSAAQDLFAPELLWTVCTGFGFRALAASALTGAVCRRYPAVFVLVLLVLGMLKASMERCVC